MAKLPPIAAYYMVHYGLPYLAPSVKSLYNQVDKIIIAYTGQPSQSFTTELSCPDTKEDLLASIEPYMDKIEWFEGNWTHEHEHCDAARQAAHAAGFDWLMRSDADEIWPEGSIKHYLKQAIDRPEQQWRIPFLHFWRSFGKVCRDASHPVRLERTTGDGSGWLDCDNEKYSVCHMGYALPTPYIVYKMQVQGHRSEWRPRWFDEKWLPNAQDDVHPVIYIPPFWNTEDYDKTKLPQVLKEHEYYDKDLID